MRQINIVRNKLCKRNHDRWATDKNGWWFCMECKCLSENERKAKYRDQINARRKELAQDPIRKERKSQQDKTYKSSDQGKKAVRDLALRSKFNITLAEFEQRVLKQNNKCAICSDEFLDQKWSKFLDHDHLCCSNKTSCGKCIRGILCTGCNKGLGFFSDNPILLLNAIEYLMFPPFDRIDYNIANKFDIAFPPHLKYHLNKRYEITLDIYQRIITCQSNLCGICKIELVSGHTPTSRVVDHDHKTGKIRGLICMNCNNGLREFDDKIDSFISAIHYLSEWRKSHNITTIRIAE